MPERHFRIEEQDELCDCCADGGKSCVATCCCGSYFPTIIAALRLGWKKVAVLVFVIWIVDLVCSVLYIKAMYPVNPVMPHGAPVTYGDMNILIYVGLFHAMFILMLVLACMRVSILARYGRNDPGDCTTCFHVCCCTPCIAAQMMRWTDGRYKKYSAVETTDIEMPEDPTEEPM